MPWRVITSEAIKTINNDWNDALTEQNVKNNNTKELKPQYGIRSRCNALQCTKLLGIKYHSDNILTMTNPKMYESLAGKTHLASLLNLIIDKILVAVDGSENSERAGDYAIKLGKDLHADVVALHVVPAGKYFPEVYHEKGTKHDCAYLDKISEQSVAAGVDI